MSKESSSLQPLVNERLIIQGFKHFGGKHCETTALLKVLNYHGLFLSEDMLLGLGGGIGFIYWFMKKMPYPFIGTRNGKFPYFVKKICKRVGVRLVISQTTSVKKGYEELKAVLSATEPAIVYGDIAFLPYLGSPDAHFGGHAFVVFGIDEENDEVYISDRGINHVIISIPDLQNARSSKFSPFAPKHTLLKLSDFPSNIEKLESKIVEAILECCDNMLRPPISNIGLPGIQKWAKIIMEWPVRFKGEKLFDCLVATFINIETGGTGGNAFRSMYTGFLDEASSLLNNDRLKSAAEVFRKSGEIWDDISKAILPDSRPILRRTRELLIEKDFIFRGQNMNALERIRKINEELKVLKKESHEDLSKAPTFLGDVSRFILECSETEKKAFQTLKASSQV